MVNDTSIAVFSEILAIDQRLRTKLAKALPKGMELSHFTVLNHLVTTQGERTPTQLAKALHVSRGAMTNTLTKLEVTGDILIRPDWDDARQKYVAISEAGRLKRDMALAAVAPVFSNAENVQPQDMKQMLSLLRQLRMDMSDDV